MVTGIYPLSSGLSTENFFKFLRPGTGVPAGRITKYFDISKPVGHGLITPMKIIGISSFSRRGMALGNIVPLFILSAIFTLQGQGDDPYTLQPAPPLVGRWDLSIENADGTRFPSWLEIHQSGYRTLVGNYVGQFGSVRPIGKVLFNERRGMFRFTLPPQWERRTDDISFQGRLEGDKLNGMTTNENGDRIYWTAVRAPKLERPAAVEWGKPIELFNGTSLEGWHTRHKDLPNGWVVENGLLSNATPGNDLITDNKFMDFKLEVEFKYPEGSNSGLYLRGRYEVQIEDNHGMEATSHRIGGVYGFLTPRVNASKPAGQWQKAEVTLVGRVVTVVLNGEPVIERQIIPGITGGALDSDEGEPGPIMVQGDHGPVQFRKITLTPAKE